MSCNGLLCCNKRSASVPPSPAATAPPPHMTAAAPAHPRQPVSHRRASHAGPSNFPNRRAVGMGKAHLRNAVRFSPTLARGARSFATNSHRARQSAPEVAGNGRDQERASGRWVSPVVLSDNRGRYCSRTAVVAAARHWLLRLRIEFF
jgi:hypothetical protein